MRQVHSTQNLGRQRRSASNANSAAPTPASTAATRRAAGHSKTDCRDKIAPASNRACRIAQVNNGPGNRSPVSKTVPDNNCRTGRVNRRNNRARLTGKVSSSCSGRDRRNPARHNKPACCRDRVNRNNRRPSDGRVHPCSLVRPHQPALRNPFSNRASGKACGRADYPACCGQDCRAGPHCVCPRRAASRHRRTCDKSIGATPAPLRFAVAAVLQCRGDFR